MNPRRLPLLLAAAALLLALLLAVLWLAPGPAAGWRAWKAPAPQPPNLDDAKAALISDDPAAAAEYPEIAERPLFLPARRPASDASDAASATPPLPVEQVQFTGIIDGPTLTGVMLQDKDETRFVRQGENIGDCTLKSIAGRTITFSCKGERKQIDLPYANLADDSKAKQPPGKNQPPAAGRPAAPAPAPAPTPAAAPQPPRRPPAASGSPQTTSLGGGARTTSLGGGSKTTSLGGGRRPAPAPAKGGSP